MKVVIVNRSDLRGGAAVVSYRLMEALRSQGIDARMLVWEKLSDNRYVERAEAHFGGRLPFLAERAAIYMANGRDRSTLFQIDTGAYGLPIHRHPLVNEADVVCFNWVNQGMVSLREVERIAQMRKPIVWTMHDTWLMTGLCHHTCGCNHYEQKCGNCRLLGRKSRPNDLSARVWRRKQRLYSRVPIHFVAVSNWLARKGRGSSLLADRDVRVIHNPYALPIFHARRREKGAPLQLLIAAARLDDPIKGLPLLRNATQSLRRRFPDVAGRMRLTACGALKNPDALDGMGIECRYAGVRRPDEMPALLEQADIVVSSSLYETLPGTLVEAQAYGALPVAFDRGGQSDIVDDGRTGVLASFGSDDKESADNLADAMVRAVAMIDDTDAATLSRTLYDSVAEKFAADKIAQRYINLFNEL